MGMDITIVVVTALTFVLGGFIKGGLGVGLPTVAMGLLTFVMTPAQAAALLIAPTFATNVWQAAAGDHIGALLRRLWPMFAGTCVGTWLGAGMLTSGEGTQAVAALGVMLALYAVYGLTAPALSVPAHAEIWLGPLTGVLTGVASAATGVFMVPALMYLQALGLERDDLIQAIGLSVLVSTSALAAMLVRDGALPMAIAGASLVSLLPALLGMWLGQSLRTRVSADAFRISFFVGLLLLGAHLTLRASR